MNLLLVDDHGIVREGVAMLLASIDTAIQIVQARTAAECLEKVSSGQFDLVLLDLGLPDRPGLDALSDLKLSYPEIPVVVLSAQDDRETVVEAITRGAMGFIPKSSEDTRLLWHALNMAVSGAVTVPISILGKHKSPAVLPRAGAAAFDELPSATGDSLGLTVRQMDVLKLVVQGLPNKAIARRLDMAETTARGHVSALLSAFDVTNRTGLVFEVARRGLILTRTGDGTALR